MNSPSRWWTKWKFLRQQDEAVTRPQRDFDEYSIYRGDVVSKPILPISILIVLAVTSGFWTAATARNTPCSGKKGGVVSCTSGGKFLCKNGSVSRSKMECKR